MPIRPSRRQSRKVLSIEHECPYVRPPTINPVCQLTFWRMKTEALARLLPVTAAAVAALVSAAASAERPSPSSLTGEERWQVKTLQQELNRRDHLEGVADSQSHLNTDRLRVGGEHRGQFSNLATVPLPKKALPMAAAGLLGPNLVVSRCSMFKLLSLN